MFWKICKNCTFVYFLKKAEFSLRSDVLEPWPLHSKTTKMPKNKAKFVLACTTRQLATVPRMSLRKFFYFLSRLLHLCRRNGSSLLTLESDWQLTRKPPGDLKTTCGPHPQLLRYRPASRCWWSRSFSATWADIFGRLFKNKTKATPKIVLWTLVTFVFTHLCCCNLLLRSHFTLSLGLDTQVL